MIIGSSRLRVEQGQIIFQRKEIESKGTVHKLL